MNQWVFVNDLNNTQEI